MTDMNLKRFEELFKELIEIEPPLPGNISEQYNVCGKRDCRCKDENNPQPHGPRHLLSFTLNGKSSTLSIKSAEVNEARKMNESCKNLRSLVNRLSEESVALCRESGPSEARRQMIDAMSRVRSQISDAGNRGAPPQYLLRSRDNWKQKAQQRRDQLEKRRIRIRDLFNSREKWREEALRLRHENKKLQQERDAAERKISELESRLEACREDKKNG